MRICIGTSGWSYNGLRGIFYPQKMKSTDFLKFYSEKFSTVEVNSSFYHALNNKTVLHWYEEVPENFVFAVKADRYITHMKKLEEPEQTVPVFLKSLNSFKDKLGPVLFQLPPSFGFNSERLESFINVLPKDYLYVFEFRNRDWFVQETYEILKKRNIAMCIYNLKGYQSPLEITADFIYIRYHGTQGIGAGKYTQNDIDKLKGYISEFVSEKKDVYCYFNNDGNGAAVENAFELISKLSDNKNVI